MAYPDNIDNFTDKLNKLDNNTYVIEEEVALVNGVYEGELKHDNVSLPSINVYTGSKLTGTKVENVVISTPSLAPWKNTIRIYSEVSPVYITYQTQGDTVEADDINKVQNSIVNTQTTLNNEITRAINAETTLTNNLNSEITRAKNSETTISNALTSETSRAESSEATITTNLNAEITRATNSENNISNIITTNTPIWNDKYTKNEVDNKISAVITNLDYKEHVATFANLATTYPNPQDGWTVSVDADNITYKYNGASWIPISANSIPLATESVSGLLSSQDKTNFDDANAKKHTHSNLSLLETITQVLINNWNSAYTHISDAVRHITSAERSLWNTVSNKVDKSGDTISGQLTVLGNAQNRPIVTRGISGSSSDGTTVDSLYLNYDSNKPVQIGTTITIDPGTSSITAKASDSDMVDGKHSSDFVSRVISSSTLDFNTVQTSGIYSIKASNTNAPTSNHGTLIVEFDVGTPYQLWFPDNSNTFYKRNYSPSSTSWSAWVNTLGLDTLGADAKYATKTDIANVGYGNMLKSVYDTDGDGIVDNANHSNTSDSLSGKSASDFAPSGFGLGVTQLRNMGQIDLNTARTNGTYWVWSAPNAPSNAGAILKVEFRDPSAGIQYFWCDGNPNALYYRVYCSNTWSNWFTFAKTSDIPTSVPANGGNADTVGGKHASDFVNLSDLFAEILRGQGSDQTIYYYKLGTISNNDDSIHLTGVISGHTASYGKCTVDLIFSARDGFIVNGTASGKCSANICDLVVYQESDGSLSLYIVSGNWSEIHVFAMVASGENAKVINAGSWNTTASTGNLIWRLSDYALSNHVLYVPNVDNSLKPVLHKGLAVAWNDLKGV